MNFKKNWKRFWTLSSAREGFTLVELIVVIAILAILAGVAVPAYSGYVTKANKQADISLASEIEQALWLAHYNQELNPGATVVVYYGEGDTYKVVATDDVGAANNQNTAEDALVAAFGEGYETLRLKYDGWAEEMGPLTDGNIISYIEGSTFDSSPETLGNLLDDVQHVVGLLGGFFDGGGSASGALKEYLEANNLPVSGDGTTMANATVMYVADDLNNIVSGTNAEGVSNADVFASTWATFGEAGIEIPAFSNISDPFTATAIQFAYVEALAMYMDKEAGTNYSDILIEASKDVSDRDAMTQAMNQIVDDINTAIGGGNEGVTSAVSEYYGVTVDEEGNPSFDTKNSAAYKDAMAFTGYMQGVASSADSLIGNTDLTKENYYTDGEILNYVLNYVEVGKSLQDLGVSTGDNVIVIYYTGTDVVIVPLDY